MKLFIYCAKIPYIPENTFRKELYIMSPSTSAPDHHETKYQLVCTPEIVKSANILYSNVYSLLRLEVFDDTVQTIFLYDISRIQAVAASILDKVELEQPSSEDFAEFVSELL